MAKNFIQRSLGGSILRVLFALLLVCAYGHSQNAHMLSGVNAQKGTTYTFVPQDATKLTTFSNSNPVAVSLPSPLNVGFLKGTLFSVQNLGPSTVTINCQSCLIYFNQSQGASSITLQSGQGADIYSDGQNYSAMTGQSSQVSFSTNGSPNSVQTGLNLAAGANTVLSESGGTVTISSTGGGGGGTAANPGGQVTQEQFYDPDTLSFGGAWNSTFNKTTGEKDTANFNKIRYVTPVYNFSYTFADTTLATAGAGKTITLPCTASSPCLGIDTSNNVNSPYAVWVAATGTPEAALVTGGTCSTFSTTNCTIIITTAQAHPSGYSINSASSGIQEALNECVGPHCVIVTSPAVASSVGTYNIYSTVWAKSNKIKISGYGSTWKCYTRDRCLAYGNLVGSSAEGIIEGIEFEPGVNVDGVNIFSVKATAGEYVITTTSPHPFITGDWVIFYYSAVAQKQEARVKVLTGSSCTQGTAGSGACSTSEFEFALGNNTFVSSDAYGWANIENTAVEDIGNHVTLKDIHWLNGGATSFFSWGMVIGNDQLAVVDGASTEGSGYVFKCSTAGFCGAAIYARGDQGASPVLYVAHSQLSMQCGGNGIRYASGNGLSVRDTVIQGFSQYGVYYGGGLQPWSTDNQYEETGFCANRTYPQTGGLQVASAGIISGGPKLSITTDTALAANIPSFIADNPGVQQNNYYVVIKGNGASAGMYPIGKCLTTGSGNCTVYWPDPQLDSIAQPITYDLLVTTGSILQFAPYPGAANSVATGITRDSACTAHTGVCSYVDAQGSRTAYTMTTQTIVPKMSFWPASVLLSNGSKLKMENCGGTGLIATTYLPSVTCTGDSIATSGSGAGYSPMFYSAANAGGASAMLKYQGGPAQAGMGGLKGLWNLINFTGVPQGDVFTFNDSNFQKTLASANLRPSADVSDTAIGFDNTQGAASTNAQLAFRAPVAISEYIGSIFDNFSWKERLTASSKQFNVPAVFYQNAVALGGSFGFGPFSLSGANVYGANVLTSGNMTVIGGTITFSGNQATWVANGSPNWALASYTASTFNANQSVQAQMVGAIGPGFVGIAVRTSGTVGNYSGYTFSGNSTGSTIQKCNAAGSCPILVTGLGPTLQGDTLTLIATGTTNTNLQAFRNGTLVGTYTDSSSPITSGYPGIVLQNAGVIGNFSALEQKYAAQADVAVQNITINGTCTGCGTGSGGSTLTVNGGSAVAVPNLNATTPAAQANFINGVFQQSGNNISLEVPTGQTGSTLMIGNDARVVNAVQNTRKINNYALSSDITLGFPDFAAGLLPSGTTAITQAQGDGSGKVATTNYVDLGLGAKLNQANPVVSGGITSPSYVGGTGPWLKTVAMQSGDPTAPASGYVNFYAKTVSGSDVLCSQDSASNVNCTGAAGGTTVNVNGSPVTNINLNATTPAADANFIRCTFKVSSSNVVLECPTGTSSSTFAIGSDSRFGVTGNALTISNDGAGNASGSTFDGSGAVKISYNSIGAVPTTTTVAGHALSSNVTVNAADLAVGALPNGVTATTQSANDSSTKVATTGYVDNAVQSVAGSATYATRLSSTYSHGGDTNLTTITGWVLPLPTIPAGYNANVSCYGTYSISTAAARISLALLDAQTPQSFLATANYQTNASAFNSLTTTTNGGALQSSTAVNAAATAYTWNLQASLLQNASNSGALSLQTATSAAADAANINAGSFCSVTIYGQGQLGSVTLDNDAGTYANDVSVTPTLPTGATAGCYTTDNSAPTATTPGTCSHGTTWTTGAISVTSTGTVLKMIATGAGHTNSAEKDATYTLKGATPTASPAAGAVSNPTTVTWSSTTTGATFHYTSGDGTQAAPTCSTGSTGSSVSVTTATTYKVVACKSNYADSDVLTAAYTILAGGAAYVNSGSVYCAASSATCSTTATITAGHTLKVYVLWGSDTITLNSVTACGNTLTLVNNPTAISANTTQAANSYVLSSTGGSCTIAATFSANVSAFLVWDENSGTTTLDGTPIIGVGSGATRTSGNVTTTAAGYCFGATANYNSATGTANSPFTQGVNNTTNGAYSEYYVTPSGTNYSASFTQSPTWPTTGVGEMCFK